MRASTTSLMDRVSTSGYMARRSPGAVSTGTTIDVRNCPSPTDRRRSRIEFASAWCNRPDARRTRPICAAKRITASGVVSNSGSGKRAYSSRRRRPFRPVRARSTAITSASSSAITTTTAAQRPTAIQGTWLHASFKRNTPSAPNHSRRPPGGPLSSSYSFVLRPLLLYVG